MAKKRRARVRKSSTANWGAKGLASPTPATVIIPSGRCPFVIDDVEDESIQEWVLNVTQDKHNVLTYEKSVFKYWIRHSFDINSEEYREAVKKIELLVPDKVKNVSDLKI